MKILVTGAAGFIGFHLIGRLLSEGYDVVGIDSLNDYYDIRLKLARLAHLGINPEAALKASVCRSEDSASFRFRRMLLEERAQLEDLFKAEKFDYVVNLAAQAGVRYSLKNPFAYIDSNIYGFVNLLECCRHHPVRHMLYASSSSVYGEDAQIPFTEEQASNTPVSLYAATKRSDELLAGVYAHNHDIPLTGLRFFTVYGPWGRPDMAPMLFTRSILANEPISVFNFGRMERDFTYVDDIVEGVLRLLPDPPAGTTPSEIFNIGGGHPVSLLTFIHTLEEALGHQALLDLQPMQPGDVPRTWADTSKLQQKIHFCPQTPLKEGILHFVKWYCSESNPLKTA